MRTLTFSEPLALKLYNSGSNDTKIAKAVGKKPNTIAQWRKRKNLPPNIGSVEDGTYLTGVNYRDVLELEQVDTMSAFLIHLLRAGRQAVKAGVKPDVMEFMNVYTGRTKSEEERKEERKWAAREKVAR